ncbi:MAG: hypothetical protein AAB408_02465, partial [Patescibacteria group bacterium]
DTAKLIWITEVGAPTGGPGAIAGVDDYKFGQSPDHVTESLQAVILREAIDRHQQYKLVGPLFWYSYKDLGTSKQTNENWFGLIRYDGTPKPAYDIFKQLTH